MKTSFIAFFNKHGIACASDTDKTLYALSKKEPVVIAVTPYSPIPWDDIINAYLRQGDIPLHDDFADYAHDFIQYLTTIESKPQWAQLSDDEANVIFMGFGQDDLFPSAVDVYVRHDEDSRSLQCQYIEKRTIGHDLEAEHCLLGGFELMQPMLYGISETALNAMADRQAENLKKFKQRMTKAFKKAHCPTSIASIPFDTRGPYVGNISGLDQSHQTRLNSAIASFNIEDMVKATETFIDVNGQLEHLKSGCIGNPDSTKELAVITRTEGLVWIKHCLFGL